MVLDLYLKNAVVENLFYKFTMLVGEDATLVMDKPEEMDDVFVNKDKVLQHETIGTDINLKALSVGISLIRIMKDVPNQQPLVVREIHCTIVDSINRPAATLNTKFEAPVKK